MRAEAAVKQARGETDPADPSSAEDVDRGAVTILAFVLAGQEMAVEIDIVREILDYREPRPLPSGSGAACGMVDLRGVTVPVIDLAARLGFDTSSPSGKQLKPVGAGMSRRGVAGSPEGENAEIAISTAADDERRIIVLDLGMSASGAVLSVGVACDKVDSVQTLPIHCLEDLPRVPTGFAACPSRQASGDRETDDPSTLAGRAGLAAPDPRPSSGTGPVARQAVAAPSTEPLRGVLRLGDRLLLLIDHRSVFGLGHRDLDG